MRGDSVLPNGHQRDILDLSIQRNTHYILTATIKNFGLTGREDLDVYMKVENWNEIVTDPQDIRDYTLKISQSHFYHERLKEETSVVMIETDHPDGWSAYSYAGEQFLNYIYLNDGLWEVKGQDSGPLKITTTDKASSARFIIDVIVGSITKPIVVEVSGAID
jgi:hypothetical protein